jgi:hypothetical protein
MLDPTRWLAWSAYVGGGLRTALHWASDRTGLPLLLVGAIALVATVRLLKQTFRFAVEIAIASALLLVATKLGLLHW